MCPPTYIQFEAEFRDGTKTVEPRIDMIRKMVYLCYHDEIFEGRGQESGHRGM